MCTSTAQLKLKSQCFWISQPTIRDKQTPLTLSLTYRLVEADQSGNPPSPVLDESAATQVTSSVSKKHNNLMDFVLFGGFLLIYIKLNFSKEIMDHIIAKKKPSYSMSKINNMVPNSWFDFFFFFFFIIDYGNVSKRSLLFQIRTWR